MDPLAHTLVGAALGETSLGRRTPFGRTAAIVAANLPDVDVAAYALGQDAALGFRRGWTHGVLAQLVLPALLAGALLAGARLRGRPLAAHEVRRLVGLCYLALATHPFLDWLNTYGIRLLMPFDGRWFHGDAVFIVDPWLWLLLGGAVFLARRPGRREGLVLWLPLAVLTTALVLTARSAIPSVGPALWIGALAGIGWFAWRGRGPSSTRAAALGLALAGAWIGVLLAISLAGRAEVQAALDHAGVASRRIMVGPRPSNPLAWDVVADAPPYYLRGDLRWSRRPPLVMNPDRIPQALDSPAARAALSAPEVRGTVGWMRFPYAEIEPTPSGWDVWILDARYRRERGAGFGALKVRVAAPGLPGEPSGQ